MYSTILAATSNRHKLLELSSVGTTFGVSVVSPETRRREKALGPWPEVAETGRSYYENALLKAQAFLKWAGMDALGDDSGLEVEALGGAPGLHSRRYAAGSDSDRIQKLLSELDRLERENGEVSRRAAFCCTLVLATVRGEIYESTFRLVGTVLREPRGRGGFGYDPIILIDDLGATLAEVDFEVTATRGFRAQAASALFKTLQALGPS